MKIENISQTIITLEDEEIELFRSFLASLSKDDINRVMGSDSGRVNNIIDKIYAST